MKQIRLLPHLDDVGATYGSVIAWQQLRRQGVVATGSVMVPCPWYPFAVHDYKSEPQQDLGIHITLTSEWKIYRNRPLIGQTKYLCDDDGYFHHRTDQLVKYADPKAVCEEVEAQIQRCIEDGIKLSHIDAHMGCIYLDPFIDFTLDLSEKYKIPLFYCRNWMPLFKDMNTEFYPTAGKVKEVIQELEKRKNPIFDEFLISYAQHPYNSFQWYENYLKDVSEGTHWFALHANAHGDVDKFAPHHQWPREKDFEFFSSPQCHEFFDHMKIQLMKTIWG